MDQSQEELEEPTAILNMLNQFNRRVPALQSFRAFEQVSPARQNQSEASGDTAKKRKVECNEPSKDPNRSADESLLGM